MTEARRYVLRGAHPERQRLVDLDQLNAQQRAVVSCAGGPMLVIAGAGSGKTRTLTYRAAYLIERGLDPRALLLCTFTNRAAREMVGRVEALLSVDLRRLWAGTFHHIANLALRRFGERVGLREQFSILDREDSRELLAGCIAEEGRALTRRHLPKAAVLQQVASMAVNCQTPLAEAIRRSAPRFFEATDTIARILDRFAQRKLALSLVDFDDLLLLFKMLLAEHDDVAEQLAGRFEHVLVDEYQDTNRLQGEIVDLCAARHGNLMVVGDDAQSIYAFRGAHFRNIIEFGQRYPSAQLFKLEQNYRSSPEVLKLANASIAHNMRQYQKQLTAVRPSGMVPALIPLRDVHQQADFVAQRVLELHQDHGVPLPQIAVLYRSHAQSLELQVELGRRKVPFTVRSGLRFFEQAHIKDAVGYLRLLHNDRDLLAWQRVLKLWSGVGARTAQRVADALLAAPTPEAARALLADQKLLSSVPRSARESIGRLGQLIATLTAGGGASPRDAIRAVIDSHYRDYAATTFANAETRLEDLQQLAEFAGRYASLEQFLSELALVAGIAAEAIGPGEIEGEHMTLSTIHQSKGLEWRVVFILGLAEGRFPAAIAIRSDAETEEERRLFYVATTRAMEQLYLCYPRFAETGDGPRRLLRLSRFLAELDTPLPYERWQIEQDPGAAEATQ